MIRPKRRATSAKCSGRAALLTLALLAFVAIAFRAFAASDAPAGENAQETPIYPTAPNGAPPATEVEGAAAKNAEAMVRYKELITGTGVGFGLTPIRGGEFLLGSPMSEAKRKEWEGPQVKVRVSPFWMGTYEVTWAEYGQFMDSIDKTRRAAGRGEAETQDPWADAVSRPTPPYVPMDFEMGVDGCPAICMTQFAAKQYTKWLSMKTGRFYRLPSEAEWEFACRAGTDTPYSFEGDVVDEHAWWFDNSDGQYQKVGTRKPNPLGLFDMHGNVAEWCLDAFTKNGYADLTVMAKTADGGVLVDPVQWPKSLFPRVARGGHWDDDPDRLRSASRRGSNTSWKVQDPNLPKSIWYHTDAQWVGFRVVRPLNPPPFEEWSRYHDATLKEITVIQERQRAGER